MGTFRGRGASVDVLAISEEMRKSVQQWMSVHIVIIDPGANQVNLRNKDDSAFVWHGMARLAEYRRELAAAQVGNPTTINSVRFNIDFDRDGLIPDIKNDWRIYVLPEAVSGIPVPDPYMHVYDYIIRKAMNSSPAWVRTIECQVNAESRPNYAIELEDGEPVWA